MRALVAESNVVTRVSLRRILERAGFSVDELRDELAATCLLHQPEAPELAVLALDTLLVDFEEVCRTMRAAKPSVYIVALVPESRRIEVPAVLDAGADDFIVKPASLQETEARVRVIRRVVEAGGAARELKTDENDAKRGSTRPASGLLHDLTSSHAALEDVFSQLGLGPVEAVRPDEAGGAPAYSGWAPGLLLHHDAAFWLSVRLDVDETNARVLFDAVERYGDFSRERLMRVLRDVLGLTQDVIRTRAERWDGAQLHIPVAPIVRKAADLPRPDTLAGPLSDRNVLGIRLRNELHLVVTMTIEPVRREQPLIGHVRKMDVLAGDVRSADYQIMLLRAGTMLTEAYIRKIQAFIHSKNLSEKVDVFRPPRGTVDFLDTLELDGYA